MTLSVVSATDGTPITAFNYLVNLDNTGVTTAALPCGGLRCARPTRAIPTSCLWTSIAGVAGSTPIVTQGDQNDFGAGLDLPPGRYLVSVLADGTRSTARTSPSAPPGTREVTVRMQPYRRLPTPPSRRPSSRTSRR